MSCHYIKRELPPPGISSWTKMRLNWIDPSKIRTIQPGGSAEIILGPLENAASEVLAARIPLSGSTYYLIENRQPVGHDEHLPGSGVLIMYADDAVSECRHGQSPVRLMNADPAVPHLEGAAYDIGKKDTFLDEKNRIRIQLLEKRGDSYRILISTL
jgi:hypothetical protein